MVISYFGNDCLTCGINGDSDQLHVHHLRYNRNAEPWEYDLADVSVLCPDCHAEIHATEDQWRNLIRSSPSWIAIDFRMLADELQHLDPHEVKSVLGRAKCLARNIRYMEQP